MKKCRCAFITMIALFIIAQMSFPAAATYAGDSGNSSEWEDIIGESTSSDEFWEWLKEQGGITTEEEEYIEINGEKVDPDDPFLEWLKEQEWEVVENKGDTRNSDAIKEIAENNKQKRQEWIDNFYSKDPSVFLIVHEEEAFRELSDSIVAGINDDYQKVYAIHDWVCSHIYYDFPAADETNEHIYVIGSDKISLRPDEFTEYVGMSEFDRLMKYKRGVCGYYAGTFEKLVRVQGIPCITVIGTANKLHAWNEVYINDRWINIDTTFDSNCRYVEENKYFDGPVSHRYFDVSDEEFATNHEVTSYPVGSRSHWVLRDISAYGELNKGGDVEAPLHVFEGSAATLTVKPEVGYQLSCLSVSDKYGKELTLQPVSGSSSQFQFTMPTDDVVVKAEFVLTSDVHVSPTISSNGSPKIEATNYFRDVSVSDYFFDAVQWAIGQEITSGTSSTSFSPDQTCTKAEIVTFIWRAAGSPEPKTTSPFSDIATLDYFYKPALWAYENNMVEGSKFSPYEPCTRAMAVEILWKQAGCPGVAARANFSDVEASASYRLALDWALEKGITSGTSSTTFSPDQTCTRAQIVTFLYRDMA